MAFTFPFTQQEFTKELLEEVCRIVYDDSVVIKNPTKFGAVTLLLRNARDRLTRDELVRDLLSSAGESATLLKGNENELSRLFTEQMIHSRVLCVTEDVDNVVMWAHYADGHKGVALRLHCIEEIDNTLLIAKPVNYTDTVPSFPPIVDYIRYLTGEVPIDFARMIYDEAVYIKHENWAYEKEWRVHVPLINEAVGTGYSDWKENSQVFGAIYMGCRMPQEDAQDLMRVIEDKMPHMEVHQARTSRTRFGIEYNRVR